MSIDIVSDTKNFLTMLKKEIDVSIRSYPNKVLISGMGGSGIGGRIMETLAAYEDIGQVFSWNNYGIPAWISSSDSVICISYSGNTANSVHFNENVAVGYGSLGDVIDSSDHTVVGFEAQMTDCGSENTAFGFKAAKYNHSIRLVALGPFAGINNNSWPNMFIGYNAGGSSSDITGDKNEC